MAKTIPTIVNPDTGEIMTSKSSLKDLSEARKVLGMKQKVLEAQIAEIDAILEPVIQEFAQQGEKKFCGYWDIYRGRIQFNKGLFEKKASPKMVREYTDHKEALKKIESNEKFQKEGTAYLRFPRL